MMNRPLKVLLVGTHPIQYAAPIFRRLAQHSGLDVLVAYCSLQGSEAALDPEFGVKVRWDVPLLSGYRWVQVPNRSPCPGVGHFFGLINPGLWRLLRGLQFDAVITYTGYLHCSYWILLLAAKVARVPLIFATDAVTLQPRDASQWKRWIKPFFVPKLYGLNDIVAAGSSTGQAFIRAFGIDPARVLLLPNVVDNEWWITRAARVDRTAVRSRWQIPEASSVALFCGKLQPWKRPFDLLRAFARARLSESFLVFAGDGPLRSALEREAESLGILDRVRVLGFVNQSDLPEIYRACDLLVLPSEYEPFGLVVNEAMLCGCGVVTTDSVGAARDLIAPNENGFTYSVGDIDRLTDILRSTLSDASRLRSLGASARHRMDTWSPSENEAAVVQAVQQAVRMQANSGSHAR